LNQWWVLFNNNLTMEDISVVFVLALKIEFFFVFLKMIVMIT
jgi:hypothetical protein